MPFLAIAVGFVTSAVGLALFGCHCKNGSATSDMPFLAIDVSLFYGVRNLQRMAYQVGVSLCSTFSKY
jgi:hypothetical protein